MKKIEHKGETYYLHSYTQFLKLYINSNEDSCIIKDNKGELLFEIKAVCAHNTGFLNVI